MSSDTFWSKITINLVSDVLRKYGHILNWKKHSGHVMEVGCADGLITTKVLYPHIKDHIQKITAIDISQDFINQARKQNLDPNIDFQVMDAINDEQIEEMTGKFDYIFSFYVAHWIPDHRTFLKGLHKMLKEDGQIFLTHIVNCPVHESFQRHLREGTWSKYLPKEPIILYYTEEPEKYIRKIVEEVGFKVEVCDHEKKKFSTENYTGFTRSLIHLNPYLERIPPELREDYFQDHLKFCYESATYVKEPDVYSLSCETLTCIASK